MMEKHTVKHRSMRLQGYDYALPGAYFVTVCARRRECLFGEVMEGEMRLSAIGEIASEEWERLGKRFPWADFSRFVVMPNHMHGIVVIHENTLRGAGLGLKSETANQTLRPYNDGLTAGRGAGLGLESEAASQTLRPYNVPNVAPGSLGAIVRAYKASVTWRIHENPELSRLPIWHRNYYDHIIRHDDEWRLIDLYIRDNPRRWTEDQLHPEAPPNKFNRRS